MITCWEVEITDESDLKDGIITRKGYVTRLRFDREADAEICKDVATSYGFTAEVREVGRKEAVHESSDHH